MGDTLRWLWAEVVHAAISLGYAIRPYDMLADRRRWFWRPRQRCVSISIRPTAGPTTGDPGGTDG
jgi:hypothetical protein